MSEPLTLAALGAVALSEGIKFMYEQAKELLRRWREKKDRGETGSLEAPAASAPVLDAPLVTARVPDAVLEENAETLTALRRALIEYGDEGRRPDPADHALLETVDALRRVLELAYGQRITFRGERREPTGTRVDSKVEATEVAGYLAGVRARLDAGLDISSDVRVGHVSGEVVGVDLDYRPHGPGD